MRYRETPLKNRKRSGAGSGGATPDASGKKPGGRSCPICRKPAMQEFRPFCSKRCADIDLGKWLGGSYAIPVVEEDGSATPPDQDDES